MFHGLFRKVWLPLHLKLFENVVFFKVWSLWCWLKIGVLYLWEQNVRTLNTQTCPENLWWVALGQQSDTHTATHLLPSSVGCRETRRTVRRLTGGDKSLVGKARAADTSKRKIFFTITHQELFSHPHKSRASSCVMVLCEDKCHNQGHPTSFSFPWTLIIEQNITQYRIRLWSVQVSCPGYTSS